MSRLSTLILVCALFTVAVSRISVSSTECNNYLKKFGTANSVNGVGPTSLAYAGDAAFVTGTANVQVNLRYSDPLFNDATYFGLVKEDGKTEDSTCLDLKLLKFTSINYADPTQVTDLTLTASSNSQKKWRYLSFTINGADLGTRLVQTSNSDQYVYTGYYAVAYYAAGSTQVQYTFYFTFSVTVKRSNGAGISTVFKPLNQYETAGCTPAGVCTASASTKLIWCNDAACTNTTKPDLYLNDQFYLRQQVTTPGLQSYYLTNTTVYYVGDGLNKITTPEDVVNTVAGQVTFRLTADIAWSNVAIQVTSYLSTTTTGARRFLQTTTTTYDPVSGTTESMTCIKLKQGDSTCATCAQQCEANDGIAGSNCPACNFSQVLAVALSILLLFIF